MSHAHLGQDGRVIEIIGDVEREQVPAPEPLAEDAQITAEQMVAREVQQAVHDQFVPGMLTMQERFHTDILARMIEIPDGVEVHVGDNYIGGGKFTSPPVLVIPEPTKEDITTMARDAVHAALNQGAKLWGFLHMDNALTYMHSRIEALHKDAHALMHWRDDVHQWEAEFMAAVHKGEAPPPTTTQAIIDAVPPLPQQPSKQ